MSRNSSINITQMGTRVVTTLFLLAFLLLLATLGAGLLASLYYTPAFSFLRDAHLDFRTLRPMHVGGAAGWIYLASLAVIFDFLFKRYSEREQLCEMTLSPSALKRTIMLMLLLWVTAAVIAFFSMAMGLYSGREYLGFSPIVSVLILAGWLLFAFLFLRIQGFSLKKAPVYVWMWMTGIFLFLYAFLEAHGYLLEALRLQPVRDLAVQWKSYGTLVGSFNLLIYGGLIYMGSRTDNPRYAYSKLAFLLFFLGILNSFTNYAHHTYHIPQSPWIKWTAFLVSMTEILVLAKVMVDLTCLKGVWKSHKSRSPQLGWMLVSVTLWTFLQLILALLISIPPINTLFHGTHVILAHSMGSMIGINSFALLALSMFIYNQYYGDRNVAAMKHGNTIAIVGLNLGLLSLWLGLLIVGIGSAKSAYFKEVLPQFSGFPSWMGPMFVASGLVISLCLIFLIHPWLVLLRKRRT